jgi:hypothetical protein
MYHEYERFVTLTKRVWALLALFLASRMGYKEDLYYIDSTPWAVCHNRRMVLKKSSSN